MIFIIVVISWGQLMKKGANDKEGIPQRTSMATKQRSDQINYRKDISLSNSLIENKILMLIR